MKLYDHGPQPMVINIDAATAQNENYRTALWTGDFLQVTLMTLPVGGEIGLEVHPDTDQFLRVESGTGLVQMGDTRDTLTDRQMADQHTAIVVPAGTCHNLKNTGSSELKLYSIYAPPHHPHGTVQATKAIADAEET